MIVKDEERVIARSLASTKPYIDGWVVCDTGSSDQTKAIVERELGHLPGMLLDHGWVDFGTNRTQAIEAAKAFAEAKGWDDAWALTVDADDQLDVQGEWPPNVDAEAVMLENEAGTSSWWAYQLFNLSHDWEYIGATHEVPRRCDTKRIDAIRSSVARTKIGGDGRRRATKTKFSDDVRMLRAHLEHRPDDARSWFYLGESLRFSADEMAVDEQTAVLRQAVRAYERRVQLGGWSEEQWYAAYQMGRVLRRLGEIDQAIQVLTSAFESRPFRMEVPVELAEIYRHQRRHGMARVFADLALCSGVPSGDVLFIDETAHQGWRAAMEASLSAHNLGDNDRAAAITEAAMLGPMPQFARDRFASNMRFFRPSLASQYDYKTSERPSVPIDVLVPEEPPPSTGKISVLMTAHGTADYLQDAMQSVLDQELPNGWELELLVGVDDDYACFRVAYPIADRDSRVHVHTNGQNIGTYNTLNKLIRLSTGGFIAILDSDDIARPGRLAESIRILTARPDIDLVGSWYAKVDEQLRPLGVVKDGDNMSHGTWCARRSAYEKIGGYRGWPCGADYDFLVRARKAGLNVQRVATIWQTYRVRKNSLWHDQSTGPKSEPRRRSDKLTIEEMGSGRPPSMGDLFTVEQEAQP